MVPPGDTFDVALFSDAFRDSPVASVVIAADGNVLLWNGAAERLFGWSESEVIGRPLPFIPPDRMHEHRLMRRRDLEGQGFTGRMITRLHKNGTLLDLSVSTAPVRGQDGAVAGIISVYTDVSAERRAEEALRLRQALAEEQLEQLERSYSTAPIGLGFLDTDLRYVRVNERMAQINGRAVAEHTGMQLSEVAPDFAERIQQACREVMAAGLPVVELEVRAATPALPGVPRDWLVSLHPLRQPNGTVLGVTTVVSDVTERKQFTDELARQEKLLRLVIDGMPGLVSYLDHEYRYRFNNRGYEQWYGRPAAEITGRKIDEMLDPEAYGRVVPYLKRAFAGEQLTFEHEVRPAGQRRDVRATYSPDRGPDGQVRGVVVVVEDITEQKRWEQALRESEKRFRHIVELAAEGIWILDTEGGTTFVNPRMADLLGYPPEEILGRRFEDFLDPEDRARGQIGFERRKSGDAGPREYRFCRRNGAAIWLDITAAPMRDDEGQLTGILGMCTDVTERKLAEQQLRQTQKLESLGILAGGIAHDFNNLLAGIMGNASLAAEQVGTHEPGLRQMLDDVVAGSERAGKLTRQLLAYAGKDHGAAEPVDLARLVRELIPLLNSSMSKMVRMELDLRDVPAVKGDPGQLQQVAMNLVINAAESIPAGQAGTVQVTVERRGLSPEDYRNAVIPLEDGAAEYVALTVSDGGAGMDEEVQARIFDPFFTTKFHGRGLGLSAVLGIVRAHGGTLTLRSAPGKGTTFAVLLPAGKLEARVEQGTGTRTPVAQGTGMILVVDDEPAVRMLAERVLERYGYEVLSAEDGLAAVEMVKAHPEIRAVLLDLAMPLQSGETTAVILRELRPDLPLILSSGYSEGEALDRFGQESVRGFLQKPYTAQGLAAKVAEVLGN